MILAIETSDRLCSVALTEAERILIAFESELPMQHTRLLGRWVEQALEFIKERPELNSKGIQGVVTANGPGSFTGLRIGISYARGFAYGRDLPLVAVSNHQILAMQRPETSAETEGITLIRSRANEVYMARVNGASPLPEIKEHRVLPLQAVKEALKDVHWAVLSPYLQVEDTLLDEWRQTAVSVKTDTRYSAVLLARAGALKLSLMGADDDAALDPMYIHPFAGSL